MIRYNARHIHCVKSVLDALMEYKNKNGISEDIRADIDDAFILDFDDPEKARCISLSLGWKSIYLNYYSHKHDFCFMQICNCDTYDQRGVQMFTLDQETMSAEHDCRYEMAFVAALSWFLNTEVKWQYNDEEEEEESV